MAQLIDHIETIEQLQFIVANFELSQEQWLRFGDVDVKQYDDCLLFNYNQKAQFSDRWNAFETMSRGLLLCRRTGRVVGRSFDKFFNYGQGGRYPSRNAYPVYVFEKMDGSMGASYYDHADSKMKIYTRGSLESEQAKWATEYLDTHYPQVREELPSHHTLIFEIIAPSIDPHIVNYDYEGLVLLAVRRCDYGSFLPYFPNQGFEHAHWLDSQFGIAQHFGFRLPKLYNLSDFAEAHKIHEMTGNPDYQTEEGWVILYSDGSRWKVKTDTYRHLHATMYSLSPKMIAQFLREGTYDDMVALIPDEAPHIFDRVNTIANELRGYYDAIHNDLSKRFQSKVNSALNQFEFLSSGEPLTRDQRKEYALFVMSDGDDSALKKLMFRYLNDRNIDLNGDDRDMIWQMAYSDYDKKGQGNNE